jgi:hypothetical protein
VLDVMRGRSFEDAIQMMEYMPYRACEQILRALKSVSVGCCFPPPWGEVGGGGGGIHMPEYMRFCAHDWRLLTQQSGPRG